MSKDRCLGQKFFHLVAGETLAQYFNGDGVIEMKMFAEIDFGVYTSSQRAYKSVLAQSLTRSVIVIHLHCEPLQSGYRSFCRGRE